MGIIKAAMGAVGGSLADQWLEVIEPFNMGEGTVATCGVQVENKRGSNNKRTNYIISNGSVIHVYPNQMMLLVDGGQIIDYSAEEGYYTVNLSSSPSLFNGELKASVKDTFNRFKFGGQPSQSQKVFYINLQEIKNIKFGTKNAMSYFDPMYGAELFVRCFGSYSVKITDPLKFFKEVIPRNASKVDIQDINQQYLEEFLTALQAAINEMSDKGIKIASLPSKGLELKRYMQSCLDEEWSALRGMEVCSVAIASISYDEESKKLINMRNQGVMLADPTIREGYVQGAAARGVEAAGSNSGGAVNGFMGVNMGMSNMAGFSQTNMAQAQAMQAQRQAAAEQNSWQCSCGQKNTGKFCAECGSPKPAPVGEWTCSCGHKNTGKFCAECGSPKPVSVGEWTCSCGHKNTGKFCAECGNPKA